MYNAMIRVNFNLRHQRTGELSPVNIVLRWNGERLVYPSKERIDPKNWSIKSQRAKSGHKGYSDFNMSLTNYATDIEKVFRLVCEDLERTPTRNELRYELDKSLNRNSENRMPTFFEFIEQFIKESKVRVNPVNGTTIATNTIKKYVTTFNHLKEFATSKRVKIDFPAIDLTFYDRFSSYLTVKKGLAMNSVGKYIQTLKTFLRAADEAGCPVNLVYRSKRFRTPTELTDKVYLTRSELDELYALDLKDNKRLDKVRDLFLIGAKTGLRFSDFLNLKPENIEGSNLKVRSQKTGVKICIPIDIMVHEIFNKYRSETEVVPESISNQKMNVYLKEVCSMVKSLQGRVMVSSTVAGTQKTVIKEKWELVSTHTARRSFATNLYEDKCPVLSIMAMTGHKTESSFRSYIRLTSQDHAKIVQGYMETSNKHVA
jgi:integrase